MTFEEMVARDRSRHAWHEAGHWVTATRLGFQTDSMRVHHNGGHSGIFLTSPLATVEQVRDRCARRIMVLMAGYLSERLAEGDFNAAVQDFKNNENGDQDRAKSTELFALLLSLQSHSVGDTETTALLDTLREETIRLLQEEADTLSALHQHFSQHANREDFSKAELDALQTVQAMQSKEPFVFTEALRRYV